MGIERRLYPRYAIACEVKVVLPDGGGEFMTKATRLSRSSIQLECDTALFTAMLKQQRLPYSCCIEFKLPWHSQRFVIEASLGTHRRTSWQNSVLVLLLRDEEQALQLDNLLEQHAIPGAY